MRKTDVGPSPSPSRSLTDNPPSHPSVEGLEERRMLAGDSSSQPLRQPEDYRSERLTAADVRVLLGQAASQALDSQIIVITDREGIVVGSVRMKDVDNAAPGVRGRKKYHRVFSKAIARARTAALFASTQNAFTTRSARFIVQDHFPHPIQNTPGGPLYGVEFSTLPGSDVGLALAREQVKGAGAVGLNISGDPGGIPLYKNGIPVGGIGVAGDGRDVAVRKDLIKTLNDPDNPDRLSYQGAEEHDVDEQVALAGADGYLANRRIEASRIFIDGLALPYTFDEARDVNAVRTLAELTAAGDAFILDPVKRSPTVPFPRATFAGVHGELKNTAVPNFGIAGSNDAADDAHKLTSKDVKKIITDAVDQAINTRAGIRQPIGKAARVHVAVVDRDGDILGVFRMDDGTNFSYDVAVQKARTAAYFSDDQHAFSARGIGFMSQAFFPPGIKSTGPGPLFHVQNGLSLDGRNLDDLNREGEQNRLRNGITIFPGGVPLYKNGELVGAVGISGDGVDQDDIIAFAGGHRYQPAKAIRSDALSEDDTVQFILGKVNQLAGEFFLSGKQRRFSTGRILRELDNIRLPYVKFPRNPEL